MTRHVDFPDLPKITWFDPLNTVSRWKDHAITEIQKTKPYEFIDRKLLKPFSTLKDENPAVHAVALVALSALAAILTFDLAFSALKPTVVALSALKQVVFAAVPIAIICGYIKILWIMGTNVSKVWEVYHPSDSDSRS